jgi:sorbitol-specific phosphotransferase system component IIA
MYTPVSNFSIVEVTEAGPDRTKAVPSVFAKKKMTEALQSGDEIVFARSTALINKANRRDEPMKRVQVKRACFMCELYLESILLDLATTKLIERSFDQQRSYFTDQYTDEKFIDFKMEAVQDKQEGVEVIFEKTSTGIKATDVQTGRIVGLEEKEPSGVGGLLKLQPNRKVQLVNICMDIMDKDLEIIEITKEKKGKIKEFLGYSAFGFENISAFYIMKITEETVGGRTVERAEEIGQVWAKRKKTNTIAEVKVVKGEKELKEALDNGDKIRFKVRY